MQYFNDHDIIHTISLDYGGGKEFIDHEGERCISIVEENRVVMNITSWRGASIGAVHYYASLRVPPLRHKKIATGKILYAGGYCDKFKPELMKGLKIEITRKLTEEDFGSFPKRFEHYNVGDFTNCFNTEEEAREKAYQTFGRIFEKGWIIDEE